MTTPSPQPCPGVKGHGVINVPGAWYDIGTHIESARSVISAAQDYLPGSLNGVDAIRINHVANLIEAANELLKLAEQDRDELERQLKSA